MKYDNGFTLIELIIFIIVAAIIGTTILVGINAVLKNAPGAHNDTIAFRATQGCIEWYNGQRALNGYSSIPCPSSAVPSFCTAPSGYSLTTNVSCTTIGGDPNYKTITVNVNGAGSASLSLLIADY